MQQPNCGSSLAQRGLKELGQLFFSELPKQPSDYLPATGDCLLTIQNGKLAVFVNDNKTICAVVVESTVAPDGTESHHLRGRKNPFPTIAQMYKDYVEVMVDGKKKRPIKVPQLFLGEGDVILGKKLGGGNFAVVAEGQFRGQPVAVKTMKWPDNFYTMSADDKKSTMKDLEEQKRLLKMEYATLKDLGDHPYIVRLFGAIFSDEPFGKNYLVIELMDGSVMSELGVMADTQRIACIRMVAEGLAFLHQKQYIHRDLACRNILYSKFTGVVKIADFGLSENVTSMKLDNHTKITVRWTAPEVMNSLECSQKSDIWSFGIVICELTTKDGQKPYRGMSDSDVRAVLKEKKVSNLPRLEGIWPQPVVEVYTACLQFEPKARPSMDHVLQLLQTMADLSVPSTPAPTGQKTPHKTPEKAGSKPNATMPDTKKGTRRTDRKTNTSPGK